MNFWMLWHMIQCVQIQILELFMEGRLLTGLLRINFNLFVQVITLIWLMCIFIFTKMEKRQKLKQTKITIRVGTYKKDQCSKHPFDEHINISKWVSISVFISKEKLRKPEPNESLEVILYLTPKIVNSKGPCRSKIRKTRKCFHTGWQCPLPSVSFSWMSEERMDATRDKVPELKNAGLNKNIDPHPSHSVLFLISLPLPII